MHQTKLVANAKYPRYILKASRVPISNAYDYVIVCLCVGCAIDGKSPKISREKRNALNNNDNSCFCNKFIKSSYERANKNESEFFPAHSLLILLAN